MSQKYSGLNRREFLIKASYLLGSVGVTQMLRAEMLFDFSKKFLPEAHAAEISGAGVHHFFDLTFRAGMPLIILGTGQEFTQLGAAKFSNSPATPSEMAAAGRPEQLIYLNPKTMALAPYASNLALTQGVQTSNGHTAMFDKRNAGMNLVTPIIEHTARNAAKFVVGGVNWFGGSSVTNSLANNPNLQTIANEGAFNTLFTKPTLRLTDAEVMAVADAARGISSKQEELLKARMKDANSAMAAQAKGMELMTQDYTSALQVSGDERSKFRVGVTNVGGRNYQDIGLAVVKSLKAMENGLLGNAQLTVDTGDWHGDNTVGYSNRQSTLGEHLSIILAATMDYLRKTPSVTAPGKMLSEVTLIQLQSEFTRGITSAGSDNSDGGTDGTLLLGDMINGGYYGSFALDEARGTAQAYGFNPETGASTPGTIRNNVKEVYNTVQAILGNPTLASGSPTWTSWIKKS